VSLIHGGDTEGYILEYGTEPLDFSANCNLLGVPAGIPWAIAKAAELADKYPDPLNRRLCLAISDHVRVPADCILCGNGAADLIFRLALATKPKKAVVTAPTFAEYAIALETVGCEVRQHTLYETDGFSVTGDILARITEEIDLLFLCNPNNPTGVTIDPELMAKILETCKRSGTLLVVDECFNGFLDKPKKHSLKNRLTEYENLLILDAFTKLYGMAGVRLGYCMSKNTRLLDDMRNAGQPWAVSYLAQAAGIAALREEDYVKEARAVIQAEKKYLFHELGKLGVKTFGGEANYIFFYTDIPDFVGRIRATGILVRDCGNYAGLKNGYCRIAVRPHGENVRLIDAMTQIIRHNADQQKEQV
jgi:threonine-phosphate decarboxylase